MITIAYEVANKVVTETFVEVAGNINFPYIIIDKNVLTEPIEAWYIEDGQIKIDQVKLAQLNRERMPTLTPIEFDIKLNNAGLYDAVQDLIKDNFELRIAYTRATFFSRTDPFIDQARKALGLTEDQIDSMWQQAMTY